MIELHVSKTKYTVLLLVLQALHVSWNLNLGTHTTT